MDEITFRCRQCKAPAGEPCRGRPRLRNQAGVPFHAPRLDAGIRAANEASYQSDLERITHV